MGTVEDDIESLKLDSEETVEDSSLDWLRNIWSNREIGSTCDEWAGNIGRNSEISDSFLDVTLRSVTASLMHSNTEASLNDDDGIEKSGWHKAFGKRMLKIYIHAKQKDLEQVLVGVDDAKAFAASQTTECTLDGLEEAGEYLFLGLKIFAALESNDPQAAKKLELDRNLDFDSRRLKLTSRVGFHAIRFYFEWNFALGLPEKIDTHSVDKLIEIDPFNPKWYAAKYRVLKVRRESARGEVRRESYVPGMPSQGEIMAITKAVKMGGSHRYPCISADYLLCLAQLCRSHFCLNSDSKWQSLKYGDQEFVSFDQVAEFMRKESERILKLGGNTLKCNFIVSRLFSSILPQRYWDLDWAEKCIKTSIEINPYESKLHHRLGMIYIQMGKFRDAVPSLLQSYDLDQRNTHTLLDAAYALFGLNEFSALEELLDEAVINPCVTSGQQDEVAIFLSVFLIVKGRRNDGILKLIAACQYFASSDGIDFEKYQVAVNHTLKQIYRLSKYPSMLYEILQTVLRCLGEAKAEVKAGELKIIENLEIIFTSYRNYYYPRSRSVMPVCQSAKEESENFQNRKVVPSCNLDNNWRAPKTTNSLPPDNSIPVSIIKKSGSPDVGIHSRHIRRSVDADGKQQMITRETDEGSRWIRQEKDKRRQDGRSIHMEGNWRS